MRSVLENDAPEEHYRNKMLANAMVELGMVDTIGSGIKRMFDKQRERLFPMPDYDFSENRVKVTVVGKVLDVDYARLLTRDKTLSLLDIEMLSRIQMHRSLSKEELDYLRKRKLVEGRKMHCISPRVWLEPQDKKRNIHVIRALTMSTTGILS